jgi:hypothetical protein
MEYGIWFRAGASFRSEVRWFASLTCSHTFDLKRLLSRGSYALRGDELRLRPCCRLRGLLLLLVVLPWLGLIRFGWLKVG